MPVTYVYEQRPYTQYDDFDTLDQALRVVVTDLYELQAWPRRIIIDDVPMMYFRKPRWGRPDWDCYGPDAEELHRAWERACDAYFEEVGRKLDLQGVERKHGPAPF